jgi:hypothetical protein
MGTQSSVGTVKGIPKIAMQMAKSEVSRITTAAMIRMKR